MRRPVEEITRRIVGAIYPILNSVITDPQAKVVQERIRRGVEEVVTTMRAEADQRRADMTSGQKDAIAVARDEERATALRQRADDKLIADKALADAVASARRDEQQKAQQALSAAAITAAADKAAALSAAEAKRQQDVAAARADEQTKCAALRQSDATTAAAAQTAAVAAAKTSERTKIVGEIQVAPVTGITITLLGNVRQQIKTYVQNGPYA